MSVVGGKEDQGFRSGLGKYSPDFVYQRTQGFLNGMGVPVHVVRQPVGKVENAGVGGLVLGLDGIHEPWALNANGLQCDCRGVEPRELVGQKVGLLACRRYLARGLAGEECSAGNTSFRRQPGQSKGLFNLVLPLQCWLYQLPPNVEPHAVNDEHDRLADLALCAAPARSDPLLVELVGREELSGNKFSVAGFEQPAKKVIEVV